MANIHSFSDMNKNPQNNPTRNVPYSPLNTSNTSNGSQQSQGAQPFFSFGFRNADGTLQQVNCLEAFFPGFGVKTFVFIVTMIQVVIFLLTQIVAYFADGFQDSTAAFNCTLYEFGGKFTPAILMFYHVHRLVIPIMLHAGVGHIFFNMLSQWLFGFRLEKHYNYRRLILLYLLAGVGGNLLSAIRNTQSISVGASSSLFGLFALQIAFLIENFENLGPRRHIAIIVMVIMILGNLNLGAQKDEEGAAQNTETSKKDKVDNSAHFGGFIVGALLSVLFMKRETDPGFYKKQRLAAGGLALYFVATSLYLAFAVDRTDMEGPANGISELCGRVFSS